jgi:hypothetical protein
LAEVQDIDDHHVPRAGLGFSRTLPYVLGRAVPFEPAAEGGPGFLRQADSGGKAGVLGGGDGELLLGGVEGGRDGDGDLPVVERAARGGEAVVPGTAQACTREIFAPPGRSEDPHGKNGASRSAAWWQSQDLAEWTTWPGVSLALVRAKRPTIHCAAVASRPRSRVATTSSGK